MFCGNTDKIKAFKERCDKYDMTDILIITTLFNSGAYPPREIWGGPETMLCLLNHQSKFLLEHIAHFQKGTSGYSALDVVISVWLRDFAYNSSTEEPHYQVNNLYSTFSESGLHGGIIMVKIMLYQMFLMSNDVITALKTFWKTLPRMFWQLFEVKMWFSALSRF